MSRRRTKDVKDKDIVARRRNKDADDEDPSPTTYKWWQSETGMDAQSKLWAWVTKLRAQWAVDGISDLIHEAIYADEPISRGGMFDGRQWIGSKESGQCVLNAIKSLVDTASARLTKVRSMPCITANDADYEEKEFAVEVSSVLRRKMGGEDVEKIHPLIVRDYCIRGTACQKVEREGGDTVTRRIPIYEVLWDHREAQFGWPSVFAHVRPELRETLRARFPDYEREINEASLFTRMDPWMQFIYQGPQLADLIEVAESWHPPSAPGEEDGQHIIAIRGTTVLREPWDCPRVPIEFSYWTAPVRGVRGKGLVAEHAAAQEMINGILHDAREGIREGSQLKVFAPRSSNVNKAHLRARSPNVIEVDGAPGQIQYIAADPVSKQAWAIAFQIKDEMYNISGISQWSATANKPLGEQASGKALDTMNDNQSDRFAQVETGEQQSRVGVGRLHVDLARMMHAEAHGKVKQLFDEQPEPIAKSELASWIADYDWSRIDIDSGNYHLTIEPVNFITGTRGGKLEEIAEAGKAGLIPDPTMTASLMEEPDIQAMNRPILGPMNRIKMCISGLKKPSVDYMTIAPDDSMNLTLAKLMVKGELEQAKADGAPDVIVQRFNNFLDDVKNKEDQAAQGSPSLPGAQATNIGAMPNAATLQGGGTPPMAPPGMGPPGMPPGPGGPIPGMS